MTMNQGVGKFQPRGVAAAPARPAPVAVTPAAGGSRWAGIQSAQPRDPMLGVGDYVVRVLSNAIGVNPATREESFKGHIEVVWAADGSHSQVGERAAVINKLTGKSAQFGMERSKGYIVAAAGYATDAEYDAFDPQGHFIDSVLGASNEYSAAGLTITGRLVRVRVSRGNDVIDKTSGQPTGDFYREYSWTVVEDADQDAVKKVGA